MADIHIHSNRTQTARGVTMADNLAAVVREVSAGPQRPAALMVAGDLAFNRGEPGDYATLKELLQPLRKAGIAVHLLLGNHDDREHFQAAFPDTKRVRALVPDRHVTVLRTRWVDWYLLDSLDKKLGVGGALGRAQRAWLTRQLDAHPQKPAILVAHHSLGEAKGDLQDTKEFWEIIRPRRQVKAYVFGHSHLWQVDQDPSGVHLINLPPAAYMFRPTDPNGWVLATLIPDGLRLELRCLDRNHPAHGQVRTLQWRAP